MSYTSNNKTLESSMDTNNHIAVLESRVDHLETELSYLNKILIQCGFTDGISTLKETVWRCCKKSSFWKKPPKFLFLPGPPGYQAPGGPLSSSPGTYLDKDFR